MADGRRLLQPYGLLLLDGRQKLQHRIHKHLHLRRDGLALEVNELAPLLREYWYDDRTKANDWISRLKDAIK